jgi:hypothetical protein
VKSNGSGSLLLHPWHPTFVFTDASIPIIEEFHRTIWGKILRLP